MAEGKPITTQQLLDGMQAVASGLDETSDALRDYKRAINQSRALVAQIAEAKTQVSLKATKLEGELEVANKDRAAKAIQITDLEKALGEANVLLKQAQSEIERLMAEPADVKA